ncbi:LysR family transcriptional regulator [Agarivorans sp. TSD2052]|uniref:LysR family transcriptional regulator n=1 Tax=Agarivorans sp. TSD2052 TaxID=2937286 RepID=UPI00200C6B0B|nr:LysR family transcriptional regulator [Agarivorans sp. TSD2052]UPW19454.1 LysR family transcriptional regulator [Agarivorans sp. TSD2052]
MSKSELSNMDFNALKLLKILGEEKNTKRAAKRLFITQSGVSKALKKLREQINDPLFVREGNHLIATEKCELMLTKLPALINTLDELYNRTNVFDPAQYTGSISIDINAALSRPLMSILFKRLNKEAPNATIILHNWTSDSESKIKQGSVDIGVNFYPLDISKEIIQKNAARSKVLLCCHRSNPLLTIDRPSAYELTRYPFVLTQMPDFNRQQNQLLKVLSGSGHSPHVMVRTDKIDVSIDTTRQIPSLLVINELAKGALTEDLQLIDISHIKGVDTKSIGVLSSYKSIETPYHRWLSQITIECVQQCLASLTL